MNFLEIYTNRSKLFIISFGAAQLAAAALLDYITGKEISLEIIYLVPISMVTWYSGIRSGLIFTFISSAVLIFIEIKSGVVHSHPFFFFWDGVIIFGIFALFVIILGKLRSAMKEIKISNEELKQANAVKNDFIELAVHDLKNPLSNIIGLSSIINEEENLGKQEVKELSRRIYSSSERMIKLVNNLLMNREIELDKLKAYLETFDIIPIAEDIIEQNQSAAAAKSISINLDTKEKSLFAYADVNLTTQIIDNLISNAIKFSPPGKKVCIYLQRLIADEKNSEAKVRIEVRDEGPGLTEEDKQKLFGRFAKLSARPTGKENSSGIGLFLVKKFTEAMNGKIWCESDKNKGAVFIVELSAGKS